MRALRTALASGLAAGLVAAALSIGSVTADPGTKVLDASLTGMRGAIDASTFPGVVGGGAPWVIDRGDARLFADGRLQIQVQGLVLTATGQNPIPMGRGIVYCNAGADVILTDLVPYSADGDATVDTTVSLPSPCHGAIVFFAGQTGAGPRWFAVSGS